MKQCVGQSIRPAMLLNANVDVTGVKLPTSALSTVETSTNGLVLKSPRLRKTNEVGLMF